MTVYLLVDIGPRIKKHPHTLVRPASESLRLMMLMMVMERWIEIKSPQTLCLVVRNVRWLQDASRRLRRLYDSQRDGCTSGNTRLQVRRS